MMDGDMPGLEAAAAVAKAWLDSSADIGFRLMTNDQDPDDFYKQDYLRTAITRTPIYAFHLGKIYIPYMAEDMKYDCPRDKICRVSLRFMVTQTLTHHLSNHSGQGQLS